MKNCLKTGEQIDQKISEKYVTHRTCMLQIVNLSVPSPGKCVFDILGDKDLSTILLNFGIRNSNMFPKNGSQVASQRALDGSSPASK